MLRFLIFTTALFCVHGGKSQTRLVAGAGYVENFHAGVSWKLMSYLHFDLLAGNNFSFKNNITSLSQKLKFDLNFKKEPKHKFQFFGAFNATFWQFNNPYYKFINLSIGPEIGLRIPLKKHNSTISIHGGYMYNSVLLYKRKTYSEVAWPYNWLPSAAIQWQIPLKN